MVEDRRIQKSKAAIVNAFVELAKENEISKITITDISNLANINRKTFYANFGTIEELVAYIQETLLHGINSVLQIDSNYNSINQSKFSYLFIQFIDEHIDIIRMLYNNYDKKFVERIIYTYKNFLEYVIPSVNGVDKNKLSEYATCFLVGGIISMVEKWLNDNSTTKADIEIIILVFDSSFNELTKTLSSNS